MQAKPGAPALRVVDNPQTSRAADQVPQGNEGMQQNSHARPATGVDVPAVLAEVQSPEIPTEKLVVLAAKSWKQHTDSARIVTACMKALRARLSAEEYRALLAQMPGFII